MSDLRKAVINKDRDLVNELLHCGASINGVDWLECNTPLHLALTVNSNEIAVDLIHHGASVTAVNSNGDTPLHLASANNSVEVAAKLLQRGANFNAANIDGRTPLHVAAYRNGKDVAAILLQHGANIAAVDNVDDTPLHIASSLNYNEIASKLIHHGAVVNALGNNGENPLHAAVAGKNKQIAALLLRSGVDFNAINNRGESSLHLAIITKDKEIALELLQHGASITGANLNGDTPLHLAVWFGLDEIVIDLLQRGADANAVNKYDETPLHKINCKSRCSKKIAIELLQHGADIMGRHSGGNTPLNVALYWRNEPIAVELIMRGADIINPNKNGDTPLHLAVDSNIKEIAVDLLKRGAEVNVTNINGDTPLHLAARNNGKEIVDDLLKRGAQVTIANNYGKIPLHLAVSNNSNEIVAELLERGSNINATTEHGETPLHNACRGENIDIVDTLLQSGAEVNAVNDEGKTPLHFACFKSDEIVAHLLEHGANFTALDKNGKSPLPNMSQNMCQHICSNPYSVNALGQTALHIAAENCLLHVIEVLTKNNHTSFGDNDASSGPIDCYQTLLANRKDINGNSPIHYLAKFSEKEFQCRSDISANFKDCGESLLNIGALVNVRNNEDQTPLHVATTWEAVDVLLENGAKPNVTDMFKGDSPLMTRVKSLKDSSHEMYESVGEPRRMQYYSVHSICWKGDAAYLGCRHQWEKVIDKGMDPWVVNYKGESILDTLIKKKMFVLAIPLVDLVIDSKDVNKHFTNGKTVLHTICVSDDERILHVVDHLLKSKAKINATNNENETPLHLVCRMLSKVSEGLESIRDTAYYWTTRRMLAYGADPTLRDKKGLSCFNIAEEVPQLLDLLTQPVDINTILPLLKWSEPISENHKSKIAQVVRNQKSSQIEHYHYHREPVGSGAFGHIYGGVDERNGMEVAVKRIEKQRLLRSEDRREISNLVKLRDCEEVVKYLGHCENDHFVFIILELMEGTLEEYLEKNPRVKSLDVTLCQDIVQGLHFLHQNHILHRDIKPGNILFKVFPRIRLKLADFGLSTKAAFNATLHPVSVMHAAAGTRCWMAPELLQASDEIQHSEASDVFACGLVLHYLLSEKCHPFLSPSTTSRSAIALQNETERNIMEYKPFLNAGLSPEATHIVEEMLLEDETKRPNSGHIISHPIFWPQMKKRRFLEAVGNQEEIRLPRHAVLSPSPVELQLENNLGKDFGVVTPWNNLIPDVYIEMTRSGGRRYDTISAVDLVRFVRNCYAHASDPTRTTHVQKLLLEDFVFSDKFPSLLIEVYKAVVAHGWHNTRKEIETTLKMD